MNQLSCEPLYRDWLVGVLREGPARVVFTKTDGTERTMRCTLKESMLPDQSTDGIKKAKTINDKVLSVYDLDKSAWRSFRIDNVKSIEFVLE